MVRGEDATSHYRDTNMHDNIFTDLPVQYNSIAEATTAQAFSMPSDLKTGSLLKTLVASKGKAHILELGTGSGLATSWMMAGLHPQATMVSIDNNALLQDIAKQNIPDERIEFIVTDAYEWIRNYTGKKFDFIFADAMPGKYDLLEETLALLNEGGVYVVDDMLPQSNWPAGHAEKASAFTILLGQRKDIVLTKMGWSTGIIVAVKTTFTK